MRWLKNIFNRDEIGTPKPITPHEDYSTNEIIQQAREAEKDFDREFNGLMKQLDRVKMRANKREGG